MEYDYDFISVASVSTQTKLSDISAVIRDRRLALFRHVRRLLQALPVQ